MDIDFSSLLSPDLSSLDALLSPLQHTSPFIPPHASHQPLQGYDEKSRVHLHFESSRAGGCFSMHLKSSWDDARIARFHEWKIVQGLHPDTKIMAVEISMWLLRLFGGTMPDSVICAPPRGKTQPDQPHAAHELAAAVARQIGIESRDIIGRIGTDDQKYRSRHDNLKDQTVFQCLDKSEDRLIIVVDDVTTTGSTLTRCRKALKGKPSLLFAYVVWH